MTDPPTCTAERVSEVADSAAGYTCDLVGRASTVTRAHKDALAALTFSMVEMALGHRQGRFVAGAPTGFGKTTAIVTTLRALHESDLLANSTGVMVCQTKVEALAELKRELTRVGVPEESIGLVHSKTHDPRWEETGDHQNEASEPSVRPEEAGRRPIVLMTHARVRGARPIADLSRYKERPRFVIYDESLVVTDSVAVTLQALKPAQGYLAKYQPSPGESPVSELAEHLGYVIQAIEDEVLRLKGTEQTTALVHLPAVDDATLQVWLAALNRLNKAPTVVTRPIIDLLEVSNEPLRVVTTWGGGIAHYRVVVPEDLGSMLVLDASYPVRKLVQLDRTLRDAEEGLPQLRNLKVPFAGLKRWDDVTIRLMAQGGGRETLTTHFNQENPRERWISREVAWVLQNAEAPFLIFNYKPRDGQPDFEEVLKRDLSRIRDLDLHATVQIDGEKVSRLRWARWGSHDSTNEFQDCRTVIMVGVMLRERTELLGSALGQLRNNSAEVTPEELTDLEQSEAAHLVYQGLSRAACRQVEGDRAKPTTAYVIHKKSDHLRRHLTAAMPGVVWEEWSTWRERELGDQLTLAELAAGRIAGHLSFLTGDRISSTELKRKIQLEQAYSGKISSATFSEAITIALGRLGGRWERRGRSVVRVGSED